MPVKVYVPADLSAEHPAAVVIFSHGLGGSRNNYAYIGKYWSEHGYIAIHLQHAGSDSDVIRTGQLAQAANFGNYVDRAADVRFAIDRLTQLAKDPRHALSGKIDLDRIAIAGHSFGAYTSLAIAGQVLMIGSQERSFADLRVKCAITMSPSPPVSQQQREHAYDKITIPVFHLTGTDDLSPIQPITAEDRKIPYALTKATDQYLLVFKDGNHALFSGRGSPKQCLPLIEKSTTAFLDAYLKNDVKARDYLRTTFKDELKESGTMAWK